MWEQTFSSTDPWGFFEEVIVVIVLVGEYEYLRWGCEVVVVGLQIV